MHRQHARPAALHPLALAVLLALGGTLAHTPARAQSAASAQTTAYDLPAGPLDATLTGIARRAGRIIVIDPALVSGRTAGPVRGSLTLEQAFAQALAGSGLEIAPGGDGSYTLKKAPPALPKSEAVAPLKEAVLPVVTVRAGGERETATGPVRGYVAKRSSSGSKTDTPMREVPQSITVVTRDLIDARGVSNLAEALEYAPGFTALTYGHDERNDWSIARGIGSTYNSNFRDGLKEESSQYATSKLNTYGVERVEFLRGPASLLFGSNIPGGAVNSITKRPTPDARGELRLRGGQLGRLGIAADVSGPLSQDGSLLYRLVALDEKFDLSTPGATKRERYFAPALTVRLSRDTEATLLANYQQDRIDGNAYPYSYSAQIGYPLFAPEKGWDRYHREQWSASLLIDHRFSDTLSLHSRTRHGKNSLDYRINWIDGFISESQVARTAQSIQDEGRTWQTDNYLEAQWALGKWVNTTIAGLDISKVRGDMYYGDVATSSFDLTLGQGIGNFIEPSLVPDWVGTRRQTGVYVQNQAKFDEQFVVVTGLRKDRYRENASGEWGGGNGPIRHDKMTGRIGAVWLLSSGLSPYLSYATSFQPQSGATYDRAAFKPTTGRQFEIGVRYEPKGANAQFTAAVFDIKQQNVLTADPLHQDFSIQRGEVGSQGLELEANVSLSRNIDLTASYSYTDARVTKDTDASVVGRQNGLVPRQKLAAWVDWQPASVVQGLSLGLGVRHSSKVPNHDNTVWVPAVTLVDARLGYRLDNWEFALNARNLMNKQHLVNCSWGDCYPGDRREVIGTASYRW